MSTRYVSKDSLRRQEGLASDPVYAAAQGIQGTIATKKAGILTSQRARSLVFFLQALSLPELAGRPNPGGLKRWVREFLNELPERLGTPSMHKHGMKPGQVYNAALVRAVRSELSGVDTRIEEDFPVIGDTVYDFTSGGGCDEVPVKGAKASYPAELFLKRCRWLAEAGLESFLVSLCTDPRQLIVEPGDEQSAACVGADEILQDWTADETSGMAAASVPYLRDVVGALFEFQRRFALRQAEGFAMTSIARKVFEALDAGLRLRRIVLVNGIEGLGKSEATRAWCVQHLGAARYVDLTGINNRTSFFRSIARALGLPSSATMNAVQLQSRVEAMLQRSGLMLCIDEAHYIWPQGKRSTATEVVDWIDTALCNRGVPVGLITTEQFNKTMQRVIKNSGWNSGQFERRVKRAVALPERPDMRDLDGVARKLSPKSSDSFFKMVVGFAGGQKRHHLDALSDVIKEAEEIARQQGRDVPTFSDAKAAIDGVLVPAALDKQTIFAPSEGQGRCGCPAKAATVAEVLKDSRNGVSAPLQSEDLVEESARTVTPVSATRARGNLAPV